MTDTELIKWDAAGYLKTEEDMALYLDACLEENDPVLLAAALGDIERAYEMVQPARDRGLTCEGLCKALPAKE